MQELLTTSGTSTMNSSCGNPIDSFVWQGNMVEKPKNLSECSRKNTQ